MDIAVIGGGAAGFFSAIAAKEDYPDSSVVIFEKSKTLLAKVKISGGGRCNVTNGCAVSELPDAYPRGGRALKKAFRVFDNTHAMAWFAKRGVPLVIQEDRCVFPASQSSQSIIDCFLKEATRLKIKIKTDSGITAIQPAGDRLALFYGSAPAGIFDKVIVATGGCPKRSGLDWLEKLGHAIEDPVPSLFSFRMPSEPIVELQGVVVENALVGIEGTPIKADGPLLITHWGMSGPAILKLSSFGARVLSEKGYDFKVHVNWIHEPNHDAAADALKRIVQEHSGKLLQNVRPYFLPDRLWRHLLGKIDLPLAKKWSELGGKGVNRLVTVLTNDVYSASGRGASQEEYVTCGGVALPFVHMTTMQSKVCKNLYFAGEILDIDGITGGYNFQAAWTTGFIAGKLG